MRAGALVIVLLLGMKSFSQTTLNSYKYVVVPAKYDFSRDDDQYGINTTTKQLLEKKGFVVLSGNEAMPLTAAGNNRCIALRADVTQRKALFTTNLTLILKDCQGNIVFKSKEGKSREKEFPAAYDEALRAAFASLNDMAYQYDSTLAGPATMVATTTTSGTTTPVTTTPATTTAPAPVPSAPVPATPVVAVGEITGTLYAQVTATGYQLVDMTPRKVLTLLKTSSSDYYIADGANGIVFRKDNAWWFEHYENNKLISQKLEIKF